MPEKGYVLVTGADSGIGREFARIYAAKGYRLILVARSEEKLRKVEAELPTSAKVIPLDLSVTENCRKLVEEVADVPIDIFVNNAGFGDFGLLTETDTAKALNMVDLNCKATLLLVKEFLLRFIKEKRGQKVLTVASAAGFAPAPYMAEYYATKAFVLRLMLGWRRELKSQGHQVVLSTLCPGPVRTNFEKRANVRFQIKPMTARQVAEYAVRKLEKDKAVIVPGIKMKIAHFCSKHFSNEMLAARLLTKSAKNPAHSR